MVCQKCLIWICHQCTLSLLLIIVTNFIDEVVWGQAEIIEYNNFWGNIWKYVKRVKVELTVANITYF